MLCDSNTNLYGVLTADPDYRSHSSNVTMLVSTKPQPFCSRVTAWIPSLQSFLTLADPNGASYLVLWKFDWSTATVTSQTRIPMPQGSNYVFQCVSVDDTRGYAFLIYEQVVNFQQITPVVSQYTYDSQGQFKLVGSPLLLSNWNSNPPSCLGQPVVTVDTANRQFTFGSGPGLISPGFIVTY